MDRPTPARPGPTGSRGRGWPGLKENSRAQRRGHHSVFSLGLFKQTTTKNLSENNNRSHSYSGIIQKQNKTNNMAGVYLIKKEHQPKKGSSPQALLIKEPLAKRYCRGSRKEAVGPRELLFGEKAKFGRSRGYGRRSGRNWPRNDCQGAEQRMKVPRGI